MKKPLQHPLISGGSKGDALVHTLGLVPHPMGNPGSIPAYVCVHKSGFILWMYIVCRTFDTFNTRNKQSNLLCLFLFLLTLLTWDISYNLVTFHATCTFDTFDIPWILQEVAFLHSTLWWESFLNISNH